MRRLWCLTKPRFGHFIYVVSKIESANKLLNSQVCFLYQRIHKRSVVFPVIYLGLTFFNLSSMFRTTDVVPLSAFLRLMLVSRFRALSVSR